MLVEEMKKRQDIARFVAVLLPDALEKEYVHRSLVCFYASVVLEYVTKIKQRFADRTDLYQEFLDILSTYKRPPVDEVSLEYLYSILPDAECCHCRTN